MRQPLEQPLALLWAELAYNAALVRVRFSGHAARSFSTRSFSVGISSKAPKKSHALSGVNRAVTVTLMGRAWAWGSCCFSPLVYPLRLALFSDDLLELPLRPVCNVGVLLPEGGKPGGFAEVGHLLLLQIRQLPSVTADRRFLSFWKL